MAIQLPHTRVSPCSDEIEKIKDESKASSQGINTTLHEAQAMLKQLQKQLHSRSANDRARAAEELGHLGEKALPCVPELINALNDPEGIVRAKAAVSLGFLGATDAVTQIIHLLEDADEIVRSSAVGALSFLRDARAVPPLIQLLVDPNPEIRDRTLRALGRIGDPVAVQPLLHALKDPVPFVRWGAAVSLGFLGRSEAVEPLLTHALSDVDREMRWRAIEALGCIGDQRAIHPLLRLLANENEDSTVRAVAVVALDKIKGVKKA